jgi:hypothetical protein
VELLRAVAEGVGLLRVRGERLEATSLRHAWAQIDEGLRAGLVYAAWCQQVTLTGLPTQLRRSGSPALGALAVVTGATAGGVLPKPPGPGAALSVA